MLNRSLFHKLIQAIGQVDVDLLASRLYHQIPKYVRKLPDPHESVENIPPPFAFIEKVSAKAMWKIYVLIIVKPMCLS